MAYNSARDKLAYFKDNKQTQENQEEYDMTKYYYNREGISSAEQQQQLMQQQQHLHSDSRSYNPYLPSGGSGAVAGGGSYSMHSQVQQPQQRVPMPQLAGRSQSGGSAAIQLSGSEGGHYANVPPQMQRSATTPYGAAPNHQLYPHQLPSSRLSPAGSSDERLNGNGASQQMNYGISRPAASGFGSASESGIQYDSNSFPVLNPQQQQASRYSHATVVGPQSREEEFSNLTINEDDFPALPGSGSSHKTITSLRTELGEDSHHSHDQQQHQFLSNGSSASSSGSRPPAPSSNQMFYSNASGSGLHPPSPGLYPSSNLTPNVTPNRPKPFTLSPKLNPSAEGSAPLRPEAKYGLLGLLDVIRLTDRDLNILALGSDLTTYGLNLNSSECLYASFASPFSDHSLSSEPQFTTPLCYQMHPPSLKPEHLSKFLVETLFYMFFAMPRDSFQASAAQELYRREWRWHAELRLWLKPRSPQEQMQSHPGVQYVYFDPSAWEARLFTNTTRTPLASGFLSEEDLRGKPLSSSSSPALPSAAAHSSS